MAKKRVNELAREYDLPTKEIVARLKKAGIEVKAAASAIDETLAKAAIQGKPLPKSNGAPQRPQPPRPQGRGPLGGGPLGTGEGPAVRPSQRNLPPRQAPQPQGRGQAAPQARGGQGGPGQRGGQQGQRGPQQQGQRGPQQQGQRGPQQQGGGAGAKSRPTRSSLQGERAPGAAAGRRRVVIDSQASRRPGVGGPPKQQRPQRGRPGGRRRREIAEPQSLEQLAAERAERKDVIRVPSGATVKQVSEYLGLTAPEVIKKLMMLGEMATLTQTLTDDAIALLAEEFGKEIEVTRAADEVEAEVSFEDAEEDLVVRPPVVTIMGHVDHGKTSLLDAVRQTQVAAGEAGGITQHIGAYQVHHDGRTITFLDTPGHEAFTAMRARGAQVTDIAIIVVAADDGVKPQTKEAIDHAKAAKVPILVAVNKIDKAGADVQRVRTEMTAQGLQPVEWGGDTEFVDVSAKTKQGLDDMLETVLLMADVEGFKSNPAAEASGVVIESKLDPGRGAVVTVLVQRGTLRVGDALVAGAHWGRVRAMHDFTGERLKEAVPGQPVEVLGFDSVPDAGEYVRAVENDRKARSLAQERGHRLKTEALARRSGRGRVSLENIFDRKKADEALELNLVLKADVSGSLEAFQDEIARLPQEEVVVNVISTGVGGITESDVMLAAASDGVVLGFNVRPVGDAAQHADREDVEIRTYSVIYKAIDELRDAMQGMLAPEDVEETVGTVEVRAIFRASRIGTIAGSYVTDGKVTRGAKARLVRDGTVVYDGEIASLRRLQDDVREVAQGFECGIVLKDFQDIKEGDVLEIYETRQVERTLA